MKVPVVWRCSNTAEHGHEVDYAVRPPRAKCTCGWYVKPFELRPVCSSCGQLPRLSVVDRPCIWCGGRVLYPDPVVHVIRQIEDQT